MKFHLHLVRFLFVVIVFSTLSASVPFQNANAAITGFDPGNIIDDTVFTNTRAINAGGVQTFLESKVPACDTNGQKLSELGGHDLNGDGRVQRWEYGKEYLGQTTFTCLRDYRTPDGRLASQYIYDTALKYTINPQTFVVLLQKEMGLVTDEWPSNHQYSRATGYGCPDNTGGTCDSTYYGFENQVDWSGKMFRAILNNSPTWYTPYVLGNNYIQYNPNASCGGTTVNIRNRATQALYNYTPYQPNAAALAADYGSGDSCSAYGNRNFYLYFRDWFGFNRGPIAFTVSGSNNIYTMVGGYKLAVPYMAALQDYGVSSDSIQTVSQSYVDSVASPPSGSGISSEIGHVVKSPRDDDEDGASVYLISLNKRYQFQSMQQLYDFGFKDSDVHYLPLEFILGKQNGGALPYFVTSPTGQIFEESGAVKHMFLDYATYRSHNNPDTVASLSYFLLDKIPSGNPYTNTPTLVQLSTGSTVYLFDTNAYYTIPTYEVYSCWGFENTIHTPVYRTNNDTYLAPITPTASLSCAVKDSSGALSVLNNSERIPYTGYTSISTSPTTNPTLESMLSKIPKRGSSFGQYIKSPDSSAIWKLSSETKRLVPTYSTYQELGTPTFDTLPPSIVSQVTTNGITLAYGQNVKSDTSGAVFAAGSSERYVYAYSNMYVAYNNKWSAITELAQSDLSSAYPDNGVSIKDIVINKQDQVGYLIAANGCFNVTQQLLSALNTSTQTLSASQPYDITLFRNLAVNSCAPSTQYIKSYSQNLVYYIENSKRHPILSYSALLASNGGKEPTVMEVSPSFTANFIDATPYQ